MHVLRCGSCSIRPACSSGHHRSVLLQEVPEAACRHETGRVDRVADSFCIAVPFLPVSALPLPTALLADTGLIV